MHVSHSVMSNSATWTVAHQALLPWNSPGKNVGVGCHSLLQGSSQPRYQTSSPALQVDYLPAEQLGKPQLSGRSLIASFVWLGKIRCNKGK